MDPFANLGYGGRRRREAAYPPLPEAQADSAIQSLTGGALSGIGYVGSELDKLFGGRAVRGLLGGKPRELLSLIPGSDITGITNEADTTSGADLLKNWGYDTSKGNWVERNLLGPAVEIGLDPSTYVGGIGALTKAGKLASKTGAVTKGFIPSIRAGERTLMHGLTGAGVANVAQGAVDLAGKANVGIRQAPLVGGLAGAGIDAVGSAAKQARLVGRSLFDAKAGPVANETVQQANEFVREPAKKAAIKAASGSTFDLYQKLQPILAAGADPEEVYRHLTQLGEGVPLTSAPSLTPHAQALDEIGKTLRSLYDPMPAEEAALGLGGGRLQSQYDLDYMLRRATKGSVKPGAKTEKAFRVTNPSQIRRKEIFDLPGGTVQLEDLIRDPALSGAGRSMDVKAVRDAIEAQKFGSMGLGQQGIPLAPEFLATQRRNSGGLAKYLGGVKDEYIDIAGKVEPTVPFFSRDVPANFLARATRGADVTSAAKAVHDVIGKVGEAGGQGTNAARVVHQAGLRGEGAYTSALEALKQDPAAIVAAAQAAAGNKPFDPVRALRDALKGFTLPEGDAAAATKYMNRFTTPEEVSPVLSGLDSLTNLFKAGTYSIWPAAHGRNLISGVTENATEGTAPWSKAYGQARGMLGNPQAGDIPSLREAFVKGIIGQPQGELNQALGVPISEVGTGNPALPRRSLMDIGKETMQGLGTKEGRNPLGVAGVKERPFRDMFRDVAPRQADTNALVKGGKAVGQTVEDNLRLAQFLDLKSQGFNADAAAEKVFGTHFDYGNLSDFEKNVMKRVVPFYTFSRKNIPKQAQRALQDPRKVQVPMRLSAAGRDEEGYVPEYLQSGLAVPVGSEQDGTQRYLSQLGLPFEEAFSRLKVGKGPSDTLWKTVEGLMGTLRPELKFALENATGKQFYTGRDLADLKPGKLASGFGMLDEETARPLAQILANTPATRAISTVEKLLDERKGLGPKALSLTTGAKITDVDTEKWRAIDARHNLEEKMRGSPGIRESVDYYPTPEAKAGKTLTPEQEWQLKAYASMKLRAREAAKEKKRVGLQIGGR